ncbi:MAG: TraB/GumN family protein [Blastomonas sp.]
MRKFCILLVCLLLAGCGDWPFGKDDWDGPDSGNPAIWHVTAEGSPDGRSGEAWLFGSIHALPRTLEWQGGRLPDVMQASDRLVLEITGLEDRAAIAATFRKMGSSPNQPDLAERIEPALHAEAARLQERGKLSDDRFATMESWAAALTFASIASSGLSISSDSGVERTLTDAFERMEKPVQALETAELQFSYFDRLPESAQRQMLASVIGEADNARQGYRDLVTAWLTGDVGKLGKATRGSMLASKDLREAVLVARNRDWAGKIDAMIVRGERPLVAVGAAHLAGSGSVQSLLEERGYRVERIQ